MSYYIVFSVFSISIQIHSNHVLKNFFYFTLEIWYKRKAQIIY